MAQQKPDPLTQTAYIVEETKNGLVPSGFFIRQWNLLLAFVTQTIGDITALIASVAALTVLVNRLLGVNITTTAPIAGGGPLLDLDPISHNDSGVTPGAYGDATHVAQVTVDAKGHVTAAANVAITGGGGSNYFTGANINSMSPANTNAFATKGSLFVPRVNLTVTAVLAYIDPATAGDVYEAQIARMTTPTSGVVSSVLATSTTAAGVTTDCELIRFPFAAPVTLVAGVPYALLAIITGGLGTAVCRVCDIIPGAAAAFDPNAPGVAAYRFFDFNTVGVSPAQTATTGTTVKRALFLEGTF